MLQALTNSALDIYLQMSMDSPYLRSFLDSCSKESWFQAVSLVWKMPGIEAKQHEKFSIILQKLSKIRFVNWCFLEFSMCKLDFKLVYVYRYIWFIIIIHQQINALYMYMTKFSK